MSNYYRYNFVSPEPVYSTVKEELKSYFDTGAVDDLMFPTYLDKCLRKLGRATYVISEQILYIEDFEARLPDNFFAVREAWLCTSVAGYPYRSANSFYSQAASQDTIQVSPVISGGTPCTPPGHALEPGAQCGCGHALPRLRGFQGGAGAIVLLRRLAGRLPAWRLPARQAPQPGQAPPEALLGSHHRAPWHGPVDGHPGALPNG